MFVLSALGAVAGTFLEIHFDLAYRYEAWRYRHHHRTEDGLIMTPATQRLFQAHIEAHRRIHESE